MDPKALWKLTYGLFLLSAREGEKDNACIINTAIQAANDPARVSVCVIKGGKTHDMILNTGRFNLSTLSTEAPFALFQRFGMQSGRSTDKFEGFDGAVRAGNGILRLDRYANMFLSCKVTEQKDLGSHTWFLAEICEGEVLSSAESCTYAYYQSSIKPRPQAAPTEKKRWVCSVCGYVYEGDEVPEDFICPICKHGKEVFEPAAASPAVNGKEPEKRWVCPVCGYVHEGGTPPDKCPQCGVPGSRFTPQGSDRIWAAEHVTGVAKDAPDEIREGLRANFNGECCEAGMYLAMSRAAAREGYPEIAEYWKTAAFEEAEHAAKFAELLGEVVSPSTKENLTVRVEAENGAALGKFELAEKAGELGLDMIRDTVMEMAKDEARHGKAFKGLLERYYGK